MKKQRILFFIYDGFELLDLSGPLGVFNSSNSILGKQHYELDVLSEYGNVITSSAGVEIGSMSINDIRITNSDTLLVVGAQPEALSKINMNSSIHKWLKTSNEQCQRLGSICSGAFILARSGVLANKRATTHWRGVDALQDNFPDIKVDKQSLYTNDGNVWTSAGVTTGIDMALEIIKQDLGSDIMGKVAKGLVVYAHRPGNQSQFSQLLNSQTNSQGRFPELLFWISNNISKDIRAHDMSDFMHMSERTFYRRFTQEIGLTPSKYLEQVRLCKAKELLEEDVNIKQVMNQTGYKSEANFRQTFTSYYGLTPGVYKRIHGKH